MKICGSIVLLLLTLSAYTQERDHLDFESLLRISHPMSVQDSIYLSTVPQLALPDYLRSKELPSVHDNSGNQYFRPIFSQESYPNCMQASSIAYNFTYEINRMREVPANLPENQYTTHFAWNWLNGGMGWYGVNYLHTHEILHRCGTPSVTDYDGFYTGGGQRWMTGYDKYYHAMHNRIEGLYAIPVYTPDGLLTLKHWLFDHLEGASIGGVANFIACSPWNYTPLPDGTPEAGKLVIVAWCPEALHGMTIVGWNDSICFDYNGDTRYTNDEDINGDGIVDMQDWEIGGLKFANSYGDYWADSGFCYMMYRTLAVPIAEGGIWTNTVHVIKTKDDYTPLMTMKVTLKHNARQMIRVRAGVSYDQEIGYPTHILDFPIMQYQGLNQAMQGCDTMEQCKEIEFGLDITPLLSYVKAGQPANYFLQVYERDHLNKGAGEIIDFSLMDYSDGVQEIPYPENNIPLINNGLTVLTIPATVNIDGPSITTASLPAIQASQPYQVQLQASGGSSPYKWKLRNKYSIKNNQVSYPAITGQQLIPNVQGDSIFTIDLDFSFPFYGEFFDTIRVNAQGYVFFDDYIVHWPYLKKESFHFKHIKAIAPFKSKSIRLFSTMNDGLWFESSEEYVKFRWKASIVDQMGSSELNFALELRADGNIIMYYNGIAYSGNLDWVVGISNGDGIDYHLKDVPDPTLIPGNSATEFICQPIPEDMSLSTDGLLNIFTDDLSSIYDVHVVVTDHNNMLDARSFQLSDAFITSYAFNVNGDTNIRNGDIVLMDFSVTNIAQQAQGNVQASISSNDEFIVLNDNLQNFGSIAPGETKTAAAAFRFTVDPGIPDAYAITLENKVISSAIEKERMIISNVKAPYLHFLQVQVDDGNNGRLDPDESADLQISISNDGRAVAENVKGELQSLSEFVSIEGVSSMAYGNIEAGQVASQPFKVKASANTLNGYESKFLLKITDAAGLERTDTFQIMVGKKPVLIVDMDPENHSGPTMHLTLEEMGIYNEYTRAFPNSLDNYQSVFLCLGIHFSNYVLTEEQGNFLASYLNDGGKIFLEGRRTWGEDPQTAVHPMFNIGFVDMPFMLKVIQGIDSTFTEGMGFDNLASPPFNYYYLEPISPAYTILENQADKYSCAVAYDAGDYKTIGTIFEFGDLLDDTSMKADLLEQVLFFFDIRLSTIGIDEYRANEMLSSTFNYPNPFKDRTSIRFTLAEEHEVSLAIYNMSGQLIQTLIQDKTFPEGTHAVQWDPAGKELPNGIYFYRIVSQQQVLTRKMIRIQ